MSQEKILEKYKSKDWLYEQFITKDKTLKQIADEFGYSKSTLARYKSRFEIKKRKDYPNKGASTYADIEWLKSEYIDKNKTPIQISEELGVNRGTIFEYISKFGLIKTSTDKSEAFSNRVKNTSILEYGVSHFNAHPDIINKRKSTNIKKYGQESYLGSKAHRASNDELILISNKSPYEWGLEFDISNIILYRWIKRNPGFSDEDFIKFVENYQPNISNIENVIHQELGFDFYNKYFDKERFPNLKYKPDFKIDEQVALNVDGLYWHSVLNKPNNSYHFDMRVEYESRGLTLFQFRGDEVNFKLDIIKSVINNKNGNSDRVFARKTEVRSLPQKEANEFLNRTHLMGSIKAKHIGLYYNDKLYMVLSYKIYKNVLKVERMSSRLGYVVVGGFSKLLSFCYKNLEFEKIHYWVDLRYGKGLHLLNKGFSLEKETLGWKWTDFNRTYNRLKCRANMDDRKLSEKMHSEELGWHKIYDAGQRLYTKER